MSRPGALALVLLLSGPTLGCVTYQRGSLAFAAAEPRPGAAQTVSEEVTGQACGVFREGPYADAVDLALAQAPGADALVDARYSLENFCIVVRGRAVRLGGEAP